jgi:carbamoyltransferase
MANLAIHGAHNASLAVERDGELVVVVEFERWVNSKNIGFTSVYPLHNSKDFIVYDILGYVKDTFGISEYDTCFCHDSAPECFDKIPVKNFVDATRMGSHHAFHAYGTFYQFDLPEALCISYDGGAPDGYFHIYHMKRGENATLIKNVDIDLGSNYGFIGSLCSEIKGKRCNLVYAGKVMGLQSYGNVHEDWKDKLREYYHYKPWWRDVETRSRDMAKGFGLEFNSNNQLEGQASFDLAATSQSVFEDIVMEQVHDTIMAYPGLPICITGGCALNIVLNTKIGEKYNRKIYVAPNSSDCGLSVGILAGHVKPSKSWDVTYAGTEVLDKYMLMRYVDGRGGQKADINTMASELAAHRIMGVVQGRSEHGPRALGNRSIICNPIGADVKDTLNARVKHREWYRPFAPIVRLEDVSEYFEFEGESRWMNFCPLVRPEYLDKMPGITHVDKTARVQTVTREQNPLMYDLLTAFKQKTGIGVLLNTSFNVDGKPILSTIGEAFEVFDKTELDRLYILGYYFKK